MKQGYETEAYNGHGWTKGLRHTPSGMVVGAMFWAFDGWHGPGYETGYETGMKHVRNKRSFKIINIGKGMGLKKLGYETGMKQGVETGYGTRV